MELRCVEVALPADRADEIRSLEPASAAVDVRALPLEGSDDVRLLRILLPADAVEPLTDALADRLEDTPGFRIWVSRVEATVPRIVEEEDGEDAGRTDAVGGAGRRNGPGRISREELYTDVDEAARLRPVYPVTVALSTLVATVGLVRGDVAVIVGAMVIAPLLGPNVAFSLAATLGDLELGARAVRTAAVGLVTAFGLSLLIGLVVPVDPSVPEIAARTTPNLADVVLAFAAGSAGALAFTTGLPAALVGVMVAVALLPPLAAAGLLLGAGHVALALGALLLTLTNIVCVNLAAVVTFLAQRVRPRTWWEEEKAKRASWIALATWLALLAILVLILVLVDLPPPTARS
ncbi:MAG: TIGR00341 family protein [Gemmatimonadota bacterium]